MDVNILKRMREVERAVLDLDESVRGAAFLVMQDYILDGPVAMASPAARSSGRRSTLKRPTSETGASDEAPLPTMEPPADFTGFIDLFESESPSDNAKAIAAHLYRERGAGAFSLDEVRELAKAGGVTIPERLDRTFLTASADKKKKMFKRSAGKGMFRPSIYGEAYFKSTYKVKMGKKDRPTASGEVT